MTPRDMAVMHDPSVGRYGDCYRAALASILDLDLDAVPHVMDGLGPDDGEIFQARQREFLATLGLYPITVPYGPGHDWPLEDLLAQLASVNPGIHLILGGEAARGVGHVVVVRDGEIVHDPHPSRAGLIGPMDDGYYWVTYLGVLR